MGSHHFKPTVGGHQVYEVVSALQKAIRRGELDNALYWSTDLHLSGLDGWLWKRLLVITSEDVGPGWPEGPAVIRALYDNYKEYKSRPDNPGALFMHHAVILLCRAPKTRLVDHALTVHLVAHDDLHRPVPDEALDMHTSRGKGKGRGIDHFLDEAAKVHPEVDDPDKPVYEELEREFLRAEREATPPVKTTRAEQTQLELEEE